MVGNSMLPRSVTRVGQKIEDHKAVRLVTRIGRSALSAPLEKRFASISAFAPDPTTSVSGILSALPLNTGMLILGLLGSGHGVRLVVRHSGMSHTSSTSNTSSIKRTLPRLQFSISSRSRALASSLNCSTSQETIGSWTDCDVSIPISCCPRSGMFSMPEAKYAEQMKRHFERRSRSTPDLAEAQQCRLIPRMANTGRSPLTLVAAT